MKIRNSLAIVLLCLTIAVQLAVSTVFIKDGRAIEEKGEKCLIEVSYADYESDNRISLSFVSTCEYKNEKEYRYTVLSQGDDGIYRISELTPDKPESGIWLESTSKKKYVSPLSFYSVADASQAERTVNAAIYAGGTVLCECRIYDGRGIITAVILPDGTHL